VNTFLPKEINMDWPTENHSAENHSAGNRTQNDLHLTRRTFLTYSSAALAGLSAFGATGIASIASQAVAAEANANAKQGDKKGLTVVIFLYEGMTVLDAIGPYEVFRLMPGVQVRFAAKKAGLVQPDSGIQMLNASYGIADIDAADILVIPGGNVAVPIQDQEVLQWVNRLHQKTRWTTSVCVGSLILGAAGLLKGLQATSHWNVLDNLKFFGAEPRHERFVRQGKIITAAGVSAGIDMALSLVALEQGEDMAKTIQLLIEYDPHPPFQSGSPDKSSPANIDRARKILTEIYSAKT
jgi:transcriptional regulator GlxA family with amidase domain